MIWASTFPSNLERLVILQKRAVRVINKSAFLDHTSPIFRNLQLLKFHDIRKLQLGKFMFSYKNQLLPKCFQNLITTNEEVHSYNTRNRKLFHIEYARTKIRQFSVKYQGSLFFNTLDKEIKYCTSLVAFTRKLKNDLITNY